MSKGDEDDMLLRHTREGDELAFVSLYQRHREPLYRFSLRMLGDTAEAEDVVHDCLVSLLQRPESYDPARAPLRTYLFGVARHQVWKRLRRHGNLEGLEESGLETTADSNLGPLGILDQQRTAEQVAAAVLALTPPQREALVLFEYEGLSLAEIAVLAGVDVGTISARLHRARNTLRKSLAHLACDPVRKP